MCPSCTNRNRFPAAVLATLLFAVLATTAARAEGNSASMGMMMTVVPDGALDAARNPALLGFQKKDRSLATALRLGPYAKQTVDLEDNAEFEYELDHDYTAGLTAGYSWRSGSTVYALAFSQVPDKDQVVLNQITLSSSGMRDIPSLGMYYLESSTTEKKFEFNPSLVFAWALPLAGDGFLGMQVIAGLSYIKTETSSEYKVPLLSLFGESELNTTTMRFSLEAGFGYTQRLENGHTGIMVRTGSLSFDRESGDYSSNDSSGDSGTSSNIFRYSTGIMIAAGFYQRPLPYLGVAFEAGYRFPVTYRYRQLNEDNSRVEVSVSQVTIREKFEFKGGIEWMYSQVLTFSGGLLLSFEGKDVANLDNSNSGPNSEMQEFTIKALVLGATYRMNETTLLTATVGIIRAHIEIEKSLGSDYTRADILLGAVYNY